MSEQEWRIVHADDLADGMDEKLARFLESFKSPGDDPVWSASYYRWKTKNNPVRTGFISLAVNGGDIVSSVSVTPKFIWHRGKKIQAAEIGDTYTDIRFQRRGIFAALINDIKVRADESGCSLIYGLPNENSRPGYEKKCDFLAHPALQLANATCLFNAVKIIGQKRSRPFRIILILLASLINLSLKGLRMFWLLWGKISGVSVREVQGLGEEYNDLWERCKGQSDVSLVRDKKYLEFRFFAHPLARYRFYEARVNKTLQGYLVCKKQKNNNRRCVMIADWFYERRHPIVFLALLNRAVQEGLNQQPDLYSTWVNRSRIEKWLFMVSGFVIRKDQPLIIYKNQPGRELLSHTQRWHFTLSDSDNV